MEFTRDDAAKWMRRHLEDHRDPRCGEINLTSLTEACAGAFEADEEGGPLDDSDHWIWEVAVEVTSQPD